jgi:hypothetical protein
VDVNEVSRVRAMSAVSDDEAPAFVTLADPDGNKVCICTHVGRRQ